MKSARKFPEIPSRILMLLPAGAAKYEWLAAMVARPDKARFLPAGKIRFLHTSPIAEIRKGTTAAFVERFSAKAPRRLLEGSCGRILFCVQGCGADPREIYEVPEVRAFFGRLHQQWPCWLFFADPTAPQILQAICLCILEPILIVKRPRRPIEVRVEEEVLREFLKPSLPAFWELMDSIDACPIQSLEFLADAIEAIVGKQK